MTSKKISRISFTFLLFGVLSLLPSCKDDKPEIEDEGVKRSEFISNDRIVSFLKQQLDKENIALAPVEMYREYISPDEVRVEQDLIWQLWKEANKERLEKSGFALRPAGEDMIWNIPQQERMRIRCFPKGDMPAGGYPMVINLHGGGSYPNTPTEWGSTINESEWKAAISLSRIYEDSPSFYFVPRMSDDRKGRWYYQPQCAAFLRAYQLGVLSGIANPDRVYLTGISEGGYGTLRLALFMPDYFAAAGVLAAAENPSTEAVNLRNLAFRMEVGANDFGYSRNLYAYRWKDKHEELQRQNASDYEGMVIIQPNRDHLGTRYLDMAPWFIRQKRRTNPRHVTYEYYNIFPNGKVGTGGYSNAVYNLDFRALKRSSDNDRMLFDLVRQGNRVELTTKEIAGKVSGKVSIYLEGIDFSSPVQVYLNGALVKEGKLKPSRGVMAETMALFGDPKRIYPSKVEVQL
ncbi:MAG: alpha/beta hydrolase-fold protein [Porphyromonas sp.]|nr:alpha/beta hydrolase-fold protein [Porphyromonas sp.]